MFRSLHMKLVLVLILLIVSVMAVVGVFLINSVSNYEMNGFLTQMTNVFTPDFIVTLERTAENDGTSALRSVIEAYSAPLGIDRNRMFFILNGKTGAYIAGSDDERGTSLPLSPNTVKALSGEVGQSEDTLSDVFDIAIPLRDSDGDVLYVVGVSDTKEELSELVFNLLTILVRAILFGLIAAVLLSFILSKAITDPIERLTDSASSISAGDFEKRAEISSTDEIGTLATTFNNMAETLGNTLREVSDERNKLDTLFRHMADGVLAFDDRGKLINVNPKASEMLGRKLRLGLHYSKVFPDLLVKMENLHEDGQFLELDYEANERYLKIFLAPININEENSGVLTVMHDITEQQKLDESRREFVANVSHELRTPLTNIKGYTETLIDAGAELDDETRRSFLDIVYNESDRMTRIVKDLLTLSRLDRGKMEMLKSRMSLREAALSAVESMRIEAEAHSLKLLEDLPTDMPDIYGDKGRLTQVVINIISNAVKYNRPLGSVFVSGGVEDDRVFVRVRDTGIGIPEEDLPRIFERFYRVDKARSRQMGGTGLGLAIAKEIIEAHDGSVTFDSVYGEGSTVTMFFPVFKEEQDG